MTQTAAVTLARLLLAHMFVYFGAVKLLDRVSGEGADPGGWAAYMSAHGVPGVLLWPNILVELGCGLLLALGAWTRVGALLLLGFTVAASVFFHLDWGTPPNGHVNRLMFMKNMGMAGGLLLFLAHGGGEWSVDAWRERRAI